MTTKNYKFLITDVNNLPIIGDSPDYLLITDSQPSSAYTVTITEELSGFYTAEVAGLVAGESGSLQLIPTISGSSVYPLFVQIDGITLNDLDDVYNLVQTQTAEIFSISRTNKYGSTTLNCKEDSLLTHTVNLGVDISSWTDWDVVAYPEDALTNSNIPPLSGSYSVVVDNVTEGVITVNIGNEVLTDIVPDGKSSTKVYADVTAVDPDTNPRTVLEMILNVRRSFGG